MVYRWERLDLVRLISSIQEKPLEPDSWLLVWSDPELVDGSGPPVRTALWFADREEVLRFVEMRLLDLWFGDGTHPARSALLSLVNELAVQRRLPLRELRRWREKVNTALDGRWKLQWLGPIEDFLAGEDPEILEVHSDLDLWLAENALTPATVDLTDPAQQALVMEFLVELGN